MMSDAGKLSGESKSRSTLEIVIGSSVVALAGAVWMLGGFGGETEGVEPVRAEPTPAVVIQAHERGVDVTSGSPQEMAARLSGVFEDGRALSFGSVAFVNGVYTEGEGGGLYTGYLASTYEDGSKRLVCSVVDGRLEGTAIEWYADGATKLARTFRNGKLASQILEYFPDGRMKLRAMAGADSPNGGTLVSEVVAGRYDDSGVYGRLELDTGRVQFIFENGTTNKTNHSMAVDEQVGYMLFYDRLIGGQAAYTSDSRTIRPL